MATRKKPAGKPASSRPAVSKTAAQKATTRPAEKTTSKKPTAKKAAAATSAPGKPAAKKTATAKKASTAKTATAKAARATTTRKTTAKTAPSPPTKKPAEAGPKPLTKSPFSKKFINAQQKKLLEERARYVASAQTWKAEADSLLIDREPGDVQFDEESGDGDTLAIERERDLALSSHARQAVEEIDEALARIKAGTYGICVTSGLPIPEERLEVIPWASERVEYKVAGFRRR